MVGQFRRKRSKSAVWCYRLALFSLVYFVIVISLHRFNQVSTPQMFWLMAAGLILICVSLVLSFKAFYDLWNYGHKGGSLSVRGTVLTLGMLLPFGYYTYLGLSLPLINDVASDVFNPPQFITIEEDRIAREDEGISQLAEYTPEYGEVIIDSYPKLATRRYPADQVRVYKAVELTIKIMGWDITHTLGAPEGDQEELAGGNDEQVAAEPQNKDGEDAAVQGDEQEILLEAVSTSMIIGYKDDVVIRISSDNEDTLVDLRSSSRWGRHDFGGNAKKIIKFMDALDQSLLGIAGEG